ncbi:DUF2492 family protein [Agaribacterium haliotis]|uniref:DUF2492 family protein n=1 Tax=Agaribacterium haliotis TaxID=2013869 RepID=UPI00195CF8E9|nr:DUF2492 family protein [Agaribacterium haliotis]
MQLQQMQHVHDILALLKQDQHGYSAAGLILAIEKQFGVDARFNSCSVSDMDCEQAVRFLIERGKFIPGQSGCHSANDGSACSCASHA